MSVPIYFDLAAAEAAEDREENDAKPLPGDTDLIKALDGYRGQQWDAYWEPIWQAEDAENRRLWLSQQCGGCEDGGTGEPCGEHFGPEDACTGCDEGTGTVVCGQCALDEDGAA